jgi:capsular exopolysaccharide synthesis family protein
MSDSSPVEADEARSGLHATIRTLRRRWPVVLFVLAVVVGASAVRASVQTPEYESTTDVLLSRQNLANALTDTNDPSASSNDYSRIAETQANIASSSSVLNRTLQAAGLPSARLGELEDGARVTAKSNADILTFAVRHPDRSLARRLTSAYAQAYISYRQELDTLALRRAEAEVDQRLARLESQGRPEPSLVASLTANKQRLSTLQALQTANAYVIRPAEGASQVSPNLPRAVAVAIVLGLLLGLGLALLTDALDTKVRDTDQLAALLGLPVLSRLVAPSKELQESRELTMLVQPGAPQSEAFRILRTNVELANAANRGQALMVTSAFEQEGKSTTLANLAVAFALSGKTVALVDLDLRRPTVHEFFGLPKENGVTLIAAGRIELDAATHSIELPNQGHPVNSTPAASSAGHLNVVTSGPIPPDPGEFVISPAVREIIASLRLTHDLVLIDAPPVLRVGDGLALSASVDGVLVVARLGRVQRPTLVELRRVLKTGHSPVLGVIATGAEVDADRDYNYNYGYGYAVRPEDAVT